MTFRPLYPITCVLLLCVCTRISAQPIHVVSSIARRYTIYQLNSNYFAFTTYGHALQLQRKDVREGRQYFRRRVPHWLRTKAARKEQLPKGTVVKPFNGDRNAVDTFIYTGITLRYPVEVDDMLLTDHIVNNTDTRPVLMNNMQLVKQCTRLPYRHFEVRTK